MKYTKEMFPGCLYLFEGQSNSSSCFIQNEEDARSFMVLANYYLKDFLKIHEYNLTKDSWIMMVTLRSKSKIIKSYLKKREKSKTCDRAHDHTEVWRIVSEQMRQFIRHYVTSANKRSGREGTLVKSSFEKSYFESKEEAEIHIKKLRNQILKKEQKLKKYRGRKKFYKISKRVLNEHPFLCSKWKDLKEGLKNFRLKISMELSIVIEIEKLLLSKYLVKTLEKHLTFQ